MITSERGKKVTFSSDSLGPNYRCSFVLVTARKAHKLTHGVVVRARAAV